jgi:hypothetical protein
MTKISFLLEAEDELNYSVHYYNQQASGLGFDFLEEIDYFYPYSIPIFFNWVFRFWLLL